MHICDTGKQSARHITRRHMLKGLATGAAATVLNPFSREEALAARPDTADETQVSLVTGDDRRDMVYQAMKPFEDNIRRDIKGKRIVIKPNFVVNNTPLAATHPDAVRGVLDFLKPLCDNRIIIAESTLNKTGTMKGYENYKYLNLPDEYNVRLTDLAPEPFTRHWILDDNKTPLAVDITNMYLDPDNYIISLTRLKTHDTVVATLTLKNIVMGAPVCNHDNGGNQKPKMHSGGPVGLNYNMFLISQLTRPDFAILDGLEGMQGNGPVSGFPMEHGVALAGTDCIAVDRIGLELMNIPYENVRYLNWCANAGMGQGKRSKITVLGPNPKHHVKTYQLHDNIDWQLGDG